MHGIEEESAWNSKRTIFTFCTYFKGGVTSSGLSKSRSKIFRLHVSLYEQYFFILSLVYNRCKLIGAQQSVAEDSCPSLPAVPVSCMQSSMLAGDRSTVYYSFNAWTIESHASGNYHTQRRICLCKVVCDGILNTFFGASCVRVQQKKACHIWSSNGLNSFLS